jgi:hypothetical protein
VQQLREQQARRTGSDDGDWYVHVRSQAIKILSQAKGFISGKS